MEPLIALIAVSLVLALLGRLGVQRVAGWHRALRGGLAAMFTMTAIVHFVVLRDDLIAMVPPGLPRPDLLVTLTGILELAGAAGLLYGRTVRWAATGLSLLLVAMLPANIYAATHDIQFGGEPATPLVPRILLQLVFLAATLAVHWPYLTRSKAKPLAPTPA